MRSGFLACTTGSDAKRRMSCAQRWPTRDTSGIIVGMRFMLLTFSALACVLTAVAACSDDDPAPIASADAGFDVQVDTSSGIDAGTGDVGADDPDAEAVDAGAPIGTACGTDNSACASRFCVDGVCCDQACTGQCLSCNNAGNAGKCANIPRLKEDPSYVDDAGTTVNCTQAVGGANCDGAGKCLRTVSTSCLQGSSCLSGQCSAGTMKCLGAPGEICSALAECASNVCSVGVCQ